jgi:opacity protein-like surface antigen
MKKIVLASVLALAATAASAFEIGVTATRDYSGSDRNFGGVTLGQSFGKLNATIGAERSSVGDNDQNRFSLVGGYDLVKLGPVTVTPRLGVAYLNNQISDNGYAMTVGVGASVPVTKQVSVGLAFDRQYGQDRVNQFDGNRVTAAVKYRF